MKVLVTGGGGFLGTETCRRLVARGYDVTSISRGHYPHLTEFGVKTLKGDLCDPTTAKAAIKGMDAVFHVAAKAGVWGDYQSYYQPNVVGTENVIQGCLSAGTEYLVFTSSPSITFDGRNQEGVDESTPYAASFMTPYQETKALAEQAALAAHSEKLKTISLRPHLIWGPGDTQLVPRIVAMAKQGKLRLIGDGSQKVDAVYIENAASAHLLALDALRAGRCGGEAFFITNHEPWTLRDIIGGILVAHDLPCSPKCVPEKLAFGAGALLETWHRLQKSSKEPRMTRFVAKQLSTSHWFNPKKSIEQLGYIPEISMAEGMKNLADDVKLRKYSGSNHDYP